jgi:thiopeptide-type bacteriocin biosynthesis protein
MVSLLNMSWLSSYIYHNDTTQVLEHVRTCLKKLNLITGKDHQFFFIRYRDDGLHIRLRILSSEEDHPLIKRLLEEHLPYPLKYVPYIPEVERYGNVQTIDLAERHFHAASVLILEWLNHPGSHYIIAIKAHVAMFSAMALEPANIIQVCDNFINNWIKVLFKKELPWKEQYEQYMQIFHSAFLQYEPGLTSAISSYLESINMVEQEPVLQEFMKTSTAVINGYRNILGEQEKINSILESLIHMNNNRSGILNRDEAFVLFLVKQCIISVYETDN